MFISSGTGILAELIFISECQLDFIEFRDDRQQGLFIFRSDNRAKRERRKKLQPGILLDDGGALSQYVAWMFNAQTGGNKVVVKSH